MPIVEADQAWGLGYDGSGQTIVVMDTGIDPGHDNFTGKIVDEACFALGPLGHNGDCPNGLNTMFGTGAGVHCLFAGRCNHGTHVGGIAAGDAAYRAGVASGASLIPIQVFSEVTEARCGSGEDPCALSYTSDQVDALEYVYDTLRLSHTIAAVNMSLGGDNHGSQAACDAANAATKAAIDNLRSVGIATIISAGKDGEPDMISEPACISSAISVGATKEDDSVTGFTNAASFLSLWAPGQAITAPKWLTTNGFTTMNGTSMAAPHVSGAFAILRHADPGVSVDDMLATLQETGEPIPHAEATTTRIKITAAVVDLLGLVACDYGYDNDGDGGMDWDGGAGAGPADNNCGLAYKQSETAHKCGLGAELILLLAGIGARARRRRATPD